MLTLAAKGEKGGLENDDISDKNDYQLPNDLK